MPDNKENENVVTLHNRETIDALKQFKHLKRLKQKAKRNARKLEQPKQRTELIQPLSIKDRWLSLSRYMAVISVILFLASEAGIGTISGYMQNGNDLPLWMSVVNIWLPSIRNLGAFFALVSLPRLARKGIGYALVAIPLGGFFLFWSLMNFHQYTELKSIDAARAKETQLEDKLLKRQDIALKKESYEEARKDKQRKEEDARSLCPQNDGTKCIKARQEATKADTRYQQKQQEYDAAMAGAKATAIKETSPITDKQLNWMNAVLPLTAGILLSLL